MARVSRGKVRFLRDRFRRIILIAQFKKNLIMQAEFDCFIPQQDPAKLRKALEELAKTAKFNWVEGEFTVHPSKLTEQQIAAFDAPIDRERILVTNNPELKMLMARKSPWDLTEIDKVAHV